MSLERPTRTYRMRKRAEQTHATRQRIIEATVRLHTTVGPAHTSISAIAEEAGVSRMTVYRHFGNEEELYAACMSHADPQDHPPDARRWREIPTLEERARHALNELYAYYEQTAQETYPVYRDFDAMPPGAQQTMREYDAALADALIAGCGLRGRRRERLRAVAGHLVDFGAWYSLVVEQGLAHHEAVDLATRFLMLTACDSTRPPYRK